jgi:hypothetical protein
MDRWIRKTAVAAALLAGCTGSVGPTGAGPGQGSGGSLGTGAGNAIGTGAAGSIGTGAGGAGSGAMTCGGGIPATSQIRRLSNAEYDRTVRDLLGVTALSAANGSRPSNLLATDQAGGLTDIGWAGYKTVGANIAAQVMADAKLKAKFIACDPAARNCLHDTVVGFGRKAFRRPLTADDIAAFDAVIAAGPQITPTGAPAEVAEALLYMFLIHPSFLQKEELTEAVDTASNFTLSSHEIAARLSYLLWGSTPDEALNQAADAGQLTSAQQILAQAQRMLLDPKARDMVASFHRTYVSMGTNTRWDNINKDPAIFPAFTKDLVPAMQQETELFFDDVVFAKKGAFQDLILSRVAFVNKATAPLYGLDPSGFTADLKATTLDANRPGFLTRLGFLNAYSGYGRTSPILRGAFVTKEVLGIAIGAPPPGAEQTPLPPATAELNTNRKQVEQMTSGTNCAVCHKPYVNPPGFALEAFNAAGAWQTKEADTGAPIDTTADVALGGGGAVHVAGPADLAAAIASAPGARQQYASRWVSYAYEREGHPDDACTVQQLAGRMAASGYTVLTLIADLTQPPSFRLRRVEQ